MTIPLISWHTLPSSRREVNDEIKQLIYVREESKLSSWKNDLSICSR